jgi:hypothetical protein
MRHPWRASGTSWAGGHERSNHDTRPRRRPRGNNSALSVLSFNLIRWQDDLGMTESESLRRLVHIDCIPRSWRGGGDPVSPATTVRLAKCSSSARRHGKAANGVQDFQSKLLRRQSACMLRLSPQICVGQIWVDQIWPGAMRIASTSFRGGRLKPIRRGTVDRKNVAGLNIVNSPVALHQYDLVPPSIGRAPVGQVFHGMSQ